MPKILVVASAMVLDLPYGCTPAWWQLWKALYGLGVDLIVTPYRERPLEAPWWRTYENPCLHEGKAFAAARRARIRLKRDAGPPAVDSSLNGFQERFVREVIWRFITPRWENHLDRILERERDIDAVLFFTPPSSHFRGIPTHLRERFDVPVVYYDGDIPMSLPEFGGMDTGFNVAQGGDPSEYDFVISNSEGGLARLAELGARRAEALFWAADPDLFSPQPVPKQYDVFFYGIGDRFRRRWLEELIGEPSRSLPEVDFALGGRASGSPTGAARPLGPVPLNLFARTISASRINLNITRQPHATVFASSTCRPFELAATGAAIVSNPHLGIETWFEPDRELIVVSNAEEAAEAYRYLLANPGEAEEMGRRARDRVLQEHTYAHRARRLLDLLETPARGPGSRRGRAPELHEAEPGMKPRMYYLGTRAYQRGRILRARLRPSEGSIDGVRILGYHRIVAADDVLATPPDQFRRQLEAMLELDVKPIRLDVALDLLSEDVRTPYFCVTFDDGYQDTVDEALPILSELRIPATIFVPSGIISGELTYHWYRDPPRALTWDQAKDLTAGGLVDIQSHARGHYNLTKLDDQRAREEIFESKREIEERVGCRVTSFCYPGGIHGAREIRLVREAGFRAGVTTNPGLNRGGEPLETLRRTMIYWRDTPADFRAKATGALDSTTMLQRWVHGRRRARV